MFLAAEETCPFLCCAVLCDKGWSNGFIHAQRTCETSTVAHNNYQPRLAFLIICYIYLSKIPIFLYDVFGRRWALSFPLFCGSLRQGLVKWFHSCLINMRNQHSRSQQLSASLSLPYYLLYIPIKNTNFSIWCFWPPMSPVLSSVVRFFATRAGQMVSYMPNKHAEPAQSLTTTISLA